MIGVGPSFPSILDDSEDQPFTDQDLQAIDAIEAALQATSTAAHITKKRHRSSSSPQNNSKTTSRHQLPNSILGLCKPFALSPCQENVRMRYPAMKFGGRIIYSRTPIEVESAARELWRSLKAKQGGMTQVSIGFDMEWKPSFRAGVSPGKAAVMQICVDNSCCHVMHIFHSGITQSLQLLLEDSKILKVGVSIGNDCVKLYKDYTVSVKDVKDLSYLANQKFGREPRNWSLQSLTETFVCKELPKANEVRLGNWEADTLSTEQLHYAATDAFASWCLYQVLENLPDTKDAAADITEVRN